MSVPILFDRARLRRRQPAAQHFLREEAMHQAEEALASIQRIFPRMVTLGAPLPPREGTVLQVSAAFAPQQGIALHADEEWLPFAENSLDACVSVWGMHWVNDVPGMLSQVQRILKPDGLFLAILPGAETLRELRQALTQAEAELTGGMRPRVAPLPDVREAGALLQRVGFTLPVASSETITATYPDLMALMHDLRSMGETSILTAAQKTFTRRSLFAHTAQYYDMDRDKEGQLPATFEFITLMGWKQP